MDADVSSNGRTDRSNSWALPNKCGVATTGGGGTSKKAKQNSLVGSLVIDRRGIGSAAYMRGFRHPGTRRKLTMTGVGDRSGRERNRSLPKTLGVYHCEGASCARTAGSFGADNWCGRGWFWSGREGLRSALRQGGSQSGCGRQQQQKQQQQLAACNKGC